MFRGRNIQDEEFGFVKSRSAYAVLLVRNPIFLSKQDEDFVSDATVVLNSARVHNANNRFVNLIVFAKTRGK